MGKKGYYLKLRDVIIPGSNHRNKRGRFGDYNSERYIEFKELILSHVRNFSPILKPAVKNKSKRNVVMSLTLYFKKAGRPDIDGCLKCLQDSLEGYAYENDYQIKQYRQLIIEDYVGFDGFDLLIEEI